MNIFLNNRYRKIHITDEKLFYVIYKKNKINITKYFKKKWGNKKRIQASNPAKIKEGWWYRR
jgi:hypothetical protein